MNYTNKLAKSLGAIALATVLGPAAQAYMYQVTTIGTLSGGSYSDAHAINNHGHVAGVADIAGNFQRGFFYDGSLHAVVPGSGGNRSYAFDLNDNDEITGYRNRYFAGTGTMMNQGYLWKYNNGIVYNIGNFAASDYRESIGYCVSSNGTVGGGAAGWGGAPGYSAMTWTTANGLDHIATLGPSDTDTFTTGIHPTGGACGYGTDINGDVKSFRFLAGTLYNIGGYSPGAGITLDTYAQDINDDGIIVGNYRVDSNTFRACKRLPGQSFVALGKLSGAGGTEDDSSGINAINSNGDMVGYSEIGNTNNRAILIPNGGSMIDLNTLLPAGSGWVLEFARDINDQGWICGQGTYNGAKRGFIMKPFVNITGTVTLQDYDVDENGHWVTFQIRNATTKQVLESQTIPLGAGGSYSLNTNAVGSNKELYIKPYHWLGDAKAVNLSTNLINQNFSLVNGDCDGDNEVNLVDLAQIGAAFGKAWGEAGYDWNADLNGDLEVNLVDVGIASARFGQVGEE